MPLPSAIPDAPAPTKVTFKVEKKISSRPPSRTHSYDASFIDRLDIVHSQIDQQSQQQYPLIPFGSDNSTMIYNNSYTTGSGVANPLYQQPPFQKNSHFAGGPINGSNIPNSMQIPYTQAEPFQNPYTAPTTSSCCAPVQNTTTNNVNSIGLFNGNLNGIHHVNGTGNGVTRHSSSNLKQEPLDNSNGNVFINGHSNGSMDYQMSVPTNVISNTNNGNGFFNGSAIGQGNDHNDVIDYQLPRNLLMQAGGHIVSTSSTFPQGPPTANSFLENQQYPVQEPFPVEAASSVAGMQWTAQQTAPPNYTPIYGTEQHPVQLSQWERSRHPAQLPMELMDATTHELPKDSCNNECMCGDGCECLGCTAHPYNNATKNYVKSTLQDIDEDQPSPFSNSSGHSRGNSVHLPQLHDDVITNGGIRPGSGHETYSPLPDFSAEKKTPNDFDDNYLYVEYNFGECGGDESQCNCGDDCSCIGCQFHAKNDPSLSMFDIGSNGDGFVPPPSHDNGLEHSGTFSTSNGQNLDSGVTPKAELKRSCCS
jgi:hypothetical protein